MPRFGLLCSLENVDIKDTLAARNGGLGYLLGFVGSDCLLEHERRQIPDPVEHLPKFRRFDTPARLMAAKIAERGRSSGRISSIPEQITMPRRFVVTTLGGQQVGTMGAIFAANVVHWVVGDVDLVLDTESAGQVCK